MIRSTPSAVLLAIVLFAALTAAAEPTSEQRSQLQEALDLTYADRIPEATEKAYAACQLDKEVTSKNICSGGKGASTDNSASVSA